MRIIFFGSDDFAKLHLEALLKSHHTVVACVTKPDTRQGRGMQIVLSPIKILAAEHNIPYLQPESLKTPDSAEQLIEFSADMFVVVAYGKLLPQEILNIPKMFCVNVHGSLLPKYRGAAPINWAILNGDMHTGVTVQKMELALDAGDIIAQAGMDIPMDMSADVLRLTMAQVGATLLVETLDQIEHKKYQLIPQSDEQSSYAVKLTKEMGRIDWHKPAAVIYNQVRGLKPWPGTYAAWNGKTLKIISVEIADASGQPGEVIGIDKRGFTVACQHGALLIKEVQPEAGKLMPASSFVSGYKISQGSYLA